MTSNNKNTTQQPEGRTALLVIDVQAGLFERGKPIYQEEELLARINRLVEKAHAADAPVFYIQHADPHWMAKGSREWQLHADLKPQHKDAIVHKVHSNAFEETNLDELLRSLQVTRLVLCGLVTHGCVKNTCRGALAGGYAVTLAGDAHSSFSGEAESLIAKWNQELGRRGAAVLPADEVQFQ